MLQKYDIVYRDTRMHGSLYTWIQGRMDTGTFEQMFKCSYERFGSRRGVGGRGAGAGQSLARLYGGITRVGAGRSWELGKLDGAASCELGARQAELRTT